MGKAHALGHAARVQNVLAGAAGALPLHGLAVIVKLQRDADDVISFAREHGRDDRRVHPPDMATTTRVSEGARAKPRLFRPAPASLSRRFWARRWLAQRRYEVRQSAKWKSWAHARIVPRSDRAEAA